ncbi:MAG: hypothetical protein IH874_05750 [Candidatus Dadabacteria bacterium]|nr:hypothetical protein [Candidatus Dadabacteria bacterium]
MGVRGFKSVNRRFVLLVWDFIMNYSNELIVGFDAREMWSEIGDSWDDLRKNDYLYLLDVERVFSTDNMIWNPAYVDLYRITKSHVLNFYTSPYGYWENLAKLEEFLEQYRSELKSKKYNIVLFTMIASACSLKDLRRWDADDMKLNSKDDELRKKSIEWARERGVKISWDDSWNLLGYDVANHAGSISGLSNTGFNTEDRETLREKWGPHLNEHHLFDDVSRAVEFKEFIDEEVPEHAPFYIYGIRLVKEWVG